MHIADAVLSPLVLTVGTVLSIIGVAIGLRHIDYEHLPHVALTTAVFFIASFLHLPLGSINIHFMMNGLMGLLLGWGAFPALLVALSLQAILFQYGGLTTLGINTLCMALPCVIIYYVCTPLLQSNRKHIIFIVGFMSGFCSVILSTIIVMFTFSLTKEDLLDVGKILIYANFPLALLEGVMCALIVNFLKKVRPTMFSNIKK